MDFLSRGFWNRSATLPFHIETRKWTIQYIIWRVMRLSWPGYSMARATHMDLVITKRRIINAGILDSRAKMSTALVQIHRPRLNRLARMHCPFDLAPAALDADLASNCNTPAIVSAPIVNDVNRRCAILPFLFSKKHPSTQFPANLPQIHEALIIMLEANLHSNLRRPWWYPFSPYYGQSLLKQGSTSTTPRLVDPSNRHPCLNHETNKQTHLPQTVCHTVSFEKLDAKDKSTANFAPRDPPTNASVSEKTRRESASTDHTPMSSVRFVILNIDEEV